MIKQKSAPGTRALLRLAGRSIRQAPLRSLLIVVLIALPVTAGTLTAVLVRTAEPTAADSRDLAIGGSDLVVSVPLDETAFALSRNGSFGSAMLGTGAFEMGPQGIPAPTPAPIIIEGADSGTEQTTEIPAPTDEEHEAFVEWLADFDPAAVTTNLERLLGGQVTFLRQGERAVTFDSNPFATQGAFGQVVVDLDLDHPLNQPSIALSSGAPPGTTTQILATEYDNEWLGADPELKVSGTVRTARSTRLMVASADGFDALSTGPKYGMFRISLGPGTPPTTEMLAAIEGTVGTKIGAISPDVRFHRQLGGGWAASPGGFESSLNTGAVAGLRIASTVLAGLLGIQVMLLAATAFAVGLRRRTRELGQLITVGANRAHLSRLITIEAVTLGAIGALVGMAAAVALASWFVDKGWVDVANGLYVGVRWNALDWAGPAVIGLLAAWAAAAYPLRSLEVDTTAGTLGWGRPPARPARFVPRTGIGLIIVGAVIFALLATTGSLGLFGLVRLQPVGTIAGVLAIFVGLLLLVGTIISAVGARADRLPVLARLAARNADRHRSRSWMVVGAFIVAIAVPVLIGASTHGYPDNYPGGSANADLHFALTSQPAGFFPYANPYIDAPTADEASAALDANRATERFMQRFATDADQAFESMTTEVVTGFADLVWAMVSDDGYYNYSGGQVAVATPELMRALDLTQVPEADKAILLGDIWGARNRETVRLHERSTLDPEAWLDLSVLEVVSGRNFYGLALVSPEVVERLDQDLVNLGVVGRAEAPLSDSDRAALRQLAYDTWQTEVADAGESSARSFGPAPAQLRFDHLSGPSAATVRLLAVLVAAAFAAVIGLVTAALSAVEVDDEIASMIAAGASPRIRRKLLGAQTLYFMGLAAALAIPASLIVFWLAVRLDEFGPRELIVPWSSVALVGVVVPLLVAALIALCFRNGRPATSRRLT